MALHRSYPYFLSHVAHQQSHHQLLGILLTSVVSGTIAGEALGILIDLCFLLGSKNLNHLRFCFIKGICHAVPPQDHILLSDLKLGHGQGTHQLSRFFTTSNVRFRLPLVYRQGKGETRFVIQKALNCPAEATLLIDAGIAWKPTKRQLKSCRSKIQISAALRSNGWQYTSSLENRRINISVYALYTNVLSSLWSALPPNGSHPIKLWLSWGFKVTHVQ